MKPSNRLLLPASDRRWELWHKSGGGNYQGGDAADTAAGLAAGKGELMVGLPVSHCRTVALSLPEAESEELAAMVFAQLEKRGLVSSSTTEDSYTTHQLVREAGSTVVSVDILDPDLPDDCCLTSAIAYLPATRLLPMPHGKLVIFPEYGRVVLAAGRGERLLHSHVIGVGHHLPEDAGQQVKATKLALEGRGLCGKITGIDLWGDFARESVEKLAEETGLPVNFSARPTPSVTALRGLQTPMLPPAVKQAQGKRARRTQLIRGLALVALLYLVGAVAAWVYLRSLKSSAAKLQGQVAESAPGAAEVKSTASSWRNMRPAIDPKRYPVLVLNEFTKVMPSGGVVVTEIDSDLEKISIEGLAKDAQTAFQLLEDVKKSTQLNAFAWSMGQPKMNDNNTARFDIVGKLND